jgi:hypothetical protein
MRLPMATQELARIKSRLVMTFFFFSIDLCSFSISLPLRLFPHRWLCRNPTKLSFRANPASFPHLMRAWVRTGIPGNNSKSNHSGSRLATRSTGLGRDDRWAIQPLDKGGREEVVRLIWVLLLLL